MFGQISAKIKTNCSSRQLQNALTITREEKNGLMTEGAIHLHLGHDLNLKIPTSCFSSQPE